MYILLEVSFQPSGHMAFTQRHLNVDVQRHDNVPARKVVIVGCNFQEGAYYIV